MTEILLGVGGGIAAYKSCELLRRLQDQGYEVTVVPTPSSLNFVGKATWEALSHKPVNTEVWEEVAQVNHVKLGDRADYILVAPATADLIARIAAGRADDLLTNSILASSAPKMLVPAMHPKMWFNPITQANIKKLREKNFIVMDPATGRLTGSDIGTGRFPDVPEIIQKFENEVAVKEDLKGVKILVTAGGTREAIDSVRFIGNRSTGKQGIAIAKIAKARGASVTLLAANMHVDDLFGIEVIPVTNTADMQSKLSEKFESCDVLIMAAAISDAKPKPKAGKIKKREFNEITLEQTPDLLAEISKSKKKQILVGFAAESKENLLAEGHRKLQAKGLDLIYANDISDGQIFGSNNTSGFIISHDLEEEIDLISKELLAKLLLDRVVERLNSPNV